MWCLFRRRAGFGAKSCLCDAPSLGSCEGTDLETSLASSNRAFTLLEDSRAPDSESKAVYWNLLESCVAEVETTTEADVNKGQGKPINPQEMLSHVCHSQSDPVTGACQLILSISVLSALEPPRMQLSALPKQYTSPCSPKTADEATQMSDPRSGLQRTVSSNFMPAGGQQIRVQCAFPEHAA